MLDQRPDEYFCDDVKSRLDQLKPEEYQKAFRLLFGEDEDAAVESYLELRQTLASVFRRRGRPDPDLLVDEVMDRLFRRVVDGLEVQSAYLYARRIAQLVLMESLRPTDPLTSIDDVVISESPDQVEEQERRKQIDNLLSKSLAQLSEIDRSLVLDYFTGERAAKIKNRRELATNLGIPMEVLRVRVHRLVKRLRRELQDGLANQEEL